MVVRAFRDWIRPPHHCPRQGARPYQVVQPRHHGQDHHCRCSRVCSLLPIWICSWIIRANIPLPLLAWSPRAFTCACHERFIASWTRITSSYLCTDLALSLCAATCSSQVPGFIADYDKFAAKGVKEIYVVVRLPPICSHERPFVWSALDSSRSRSHILSPFCQLVDVW
jgi:hypothetical protein